MDSFMGATGFFVGGGHKSFMGARAHPAPCYGPESETSGHIYPNIVCYTPMH